MLEDIKKWGRDGLTVERYKTEMMQGEKDYECVKRYKLD
jgi:hypothetical protein